MPFLWLASASAESVTVKYRGAVNLNHPEAKFTCTEVERSSVVSRVCYDTVASYMAIRLGATYCHCCGVDQGTVAGLLAATSKGQLYNSRIKGRFDCRQSPPPAYR